MAFARAIGFELQPKAAQLSDEQLAGMAAEEAQYNQVRIDARGLPAGAGPKLIEPAQDQWRQWLAARSNFDTELEPQRADIEAEDRLDREIDMQFAETRQKRERAETTWHADGENSRVLREFDEADIRLRKKRQEHDNETPNMFAYNPVYLLLLLLIGVAEWLINYDVFFMFTGIPAIAAGTTLILAALLAFAAHGHGEVVRQWSYRFDRARPPDERASSWRLLLLATVALLVVLGAAGGSRYAAVLRTMAGQSNENILGSVAMIDVNPIRDVLLSLLANFAAWIVGVFIAFYCHDRDPDFMRAQKQYDLARRRLRRRRRRVEQDIESLEAKAAERTEQMRRAARSKVDGVRAERDMLIQVTKHGSAIAALLEDDLRANADRFRTALCRQVMQRPSDVQLLGEGPDGVVPLSPGQYRNMPLHVADLLGKAAP